MNEIKIRNNVPFWATGFMYKNKITFHPYLRNDFKFDSERK
jgi:hypothetical protein